MTVRTMRLALSLAALTVLALASAPARRAEAQAFSSNATIYIDGDRIKNESIIYVDRRECQDAEWTFKLIGYSRPVPFLEMWATNDVNINCTDQANRNSVNQSRTVCWQIGGYKTNVNPNETFTVKGSEIFSASSRDSPVDKKVCDPDIRGTKYKVQFVTLEAFTMPGTATVSPSNGNPNQISAIFTLYSALPAAPANAKPINGERTMGISYSKIDNNALTRYRAYFDHDPNAVVYPEGMDGGAPAMCGTGAFIGMDGGVKAGGDVATSMTGPYASSLSKGGRASITDLDRKNIALNTYTSVAVAAVDGAGNVGQLSAPVCVKREATISYLDTCREEGVDCGDLESCSLSPRNTGSAFWLSACTLAISALARRRRRST